MDNKEKALNSFLGGYVGTSPAKSSQNKKEVIMNEREGLIERVDPIYVTREGKQLLREQY